jgi:hypothetical protein
MTVVHSGARRALAFGGGVVTGCTVARIAMWMLRPAVRKRGAPT